MLFAKEILNLDGYNFNYEKKEELRISEYSFLLDDKEYKEDFFQKTLEVSMDD